MKWLKRITGGTVLLVAMALAAYLFLFKTLVALPNPFEPPEMAAAKLAPRDAVGDLGGVAVTGWIAAGEAIVVLDLDGNADGKFDANDAEFAAAQLRPGEWHQWRCAA